MKNLENYRVEEMSDSSVTLINGGTSIGYALGVFCGAAIRYSGSFGAARISTDMAVYFAKK